MPHTALQKKSKNNVWYLGEWHILKWDNTIGQLTRCYADAVNVRLCVITTQVLQHNNTVNCNESNAENNGQRKSAVLTSANIASEE